MDLDVKVRSYRRGADFEITALSCNGRAPSLPQALIKLSTALIARHNCLQQMRDVDLTEPAREEKKQMASLFGDRIVSELGNDESR